MACGLRDTSAERIAANKSLMRHRAKNAQRKDRAPAFFELVPPTEVKPGRRQSVTVAAADAAPTCRISIGDTDIAISPGYATDYLGEVLRAVRASQ